MDRWQYLGLLAGCLIVTAPLEAFGAGVYRQASRAATAILPVAVVFIAWDAAAITTQVWTYNPRFIIGAHLLGIPVEEPLFFLVIPLCALLTYNAVNAILARLRGATRRSVRRP